MAEQNMMGIAGGLAKTGFVPVAVTYCVFATRRAGDQVQMALSTGHHTAVIAAFLPGITTPFRASHQGNDDLAIMRAVPGMTVIDPMDATELSAALRAAVEVPGPVTFGGCAARYRPCWRRRSSSPWVLPASYGRAGDLGFIGSGLGTCWALEAGEVLDAAGVPGRRTARAHPQAL